MPSRLIRDGLLESEKVLCLPVEARWLYLSILLGADDVGLFEATPFRLARRADIRREHAENLVQMLADCDLIRLYSVDGKAYGFVPKYGQRIQIKRARFPLPQVALLKGDDDAINKINSLGQNPRLANGDPPKSTVGQPSEPEPEPELEPKNYKTSTSKTPRKREPPCPDGVTVATWADWLTLRKAKRAPVTETVIQEAGLEAEKAGLSFDAFLRIWCARGSQGLQADWLKPSERGKPETISKYIKGTSLDPDFLGYPDDDGGIYGNVATLR